MVVLAVPMLLHDLKRGSKKAAPLESARSLTKGLSCVMRNVFKIYSKKEKPQPH